MDCIFCKIVAGEIPATKIYEDENILAFLDIAPVNPGHTLVIPKTHYADFMELPEEESAVIIRTIKKLAAAVMQGTGAEGFNLTLNNGAVAGQVVGHVHWHIVPRFTDDGRVLWPGQSYQEGDAAVIAEKIRQQL